MKIKRGRPTIAEPRNIRVSAYVTRDVAEIAIEQADNLNQSLSQYLGDILMAHISKYPPEALNRGE